MLQNLLDQTLELWQPGRVVDRYGSLKYVWPGTLAVATRCRLQLMSTTTDSPTAGTPRQWQVYAGREVAVATVNDRVRIDSNWFEIVSVYPVHTPQGLHHTQLVVVAYAGELPNE
jgi:hypothetical protein